MRTFVVGFSSRHPFAAGVCVVVAMLVGLIDGLWSLGEKAAPLFSAMIGWLAWPSLNLNWLPRITTPVGLVLLMLIYRQSQLNGPRHALPLANPRRIPTDRCIRRKRVKIADWANDRNLISDLTFEQCIIEGPAVVVTTGPRENHFSDITFAESKLPVMVAPKDFSVFGVLGLDGCTFRQCYFRRVGITTTAKVYAQMQGRLRQRP